MAAHIEASGRLRVGAAPADAFRFFTPEGEREWIADWDPEYLHPPDGALAEGLTFRTMHGGETTLWLVARCDLAGGTIEYVRVTPDSRMGVVSVRLTAAGANASDVSIGYRLTALSDAGEEKLEAFAAGFQQMLATWEQSIAGVLAAR